MEENKAIRILYMEDDAGLARLFQKRLGRLGYKVDIAHDGNEGLEMYRRGNYDVVIVDHNMPGRDGLQVIQVLKEEDELLPVVMITGSGSEQIAVKAMKLGASDYLVKDTDGGYLQLLPTVIEKVLQQRRLAEEKRRAEEEKERLIKELQEALAEVKKLSGLLPICSVCKRIRTDDGYWQQVEQYISEHSEAGFTHSICPDCMRKLYPEFADEIEAAEQEEELTEVKVSKELLERHES